MALKKGARLKTLTIQQKIEICRKLESGVTSAQLADEYQISVFTLRRIRRNAKTLKLFAKKGRHMLNRKNQRKPAYESVEKPLYEWFLEQKAEGGRLTTAMFQKKAIEINKDLGGPATFKVSRGWVKKFRVRHNIRSLRLDRGESSDDGTMDSFQIDSPEPIEKEPRECPTTYRWDLDADGNIVTWKEFPLKTEDDPLGMEHQLENGGLQKPEEIYVPMAEKEQIELKHEEIDIPMEEEQGQQQRLEHGILKQEREDAEDIRLKELEEALQIIAKYALNKTTLMIAHCLINDILKEEI